VIPLYAAQQTLVSLDAFEHTELKSNPHYQILHSQAAQQVCTEVAESFTSYKELLPLWYTGQLAGKPKLPKYRKKGGYAGFTYPKQALLFGIETGRINNQKIVQTPTARLKKRIYEVYQEYEIQFIETEESYTSGSSFLDGDSLPKYGEKLAAGCGK
jgi:hypothetical protein